jgi:hypothetical protein
LHEKHVQVTIKGIFLHLNSKNNRTLELKEVLNAGLKGEIYGIPGGNGRCIVYLVGSRPTKF